ncbi:MAG: hypothetical protein P1V81_03040 [Planctomycetota bacterium]|nr:hypothetical protein [Planctomycetota bacterium]
MVRLPGSLLLAACALVAPLASAQVNEVPGTDVLLAKMEQIVSYGHVGAFPTGFNAIAISTTACNKGTVKVPWQGPMDENHPMIATLLARESNGRLEQISAYSHIKHGFYALTSNYCDTCQEGPFGGGDVLGLGCSDTYKASNNADQFFLGPADEINPWLGLWDANCSYFDKGNGPAPAPQDCDGIRSLTQGQVDTFGPLKNRVNVADADLDVAGASYYFQGHYIVRGEPSANRGNNLGHREFLPSWTGTQWTMPAVGGIGQGDFTNGTVLNRWTGASVSSVQNGLDDGLLYVATKVTGPVDGVYRYEYAVHNRDNARGVDSFQVPLCSGARVFNVGFKDVDLDGGNQWSSTVGATDITWSGPGNALKWNSIYNFWFESDAAPVAGVALMDAALAGPGLATLPVTIDTPGALYNVYLGDGCAVGTPPTLFATGTPPQATIGNAGFGLRSTGNQPTEIQLLYMSLLNGTVDYGGGCVQYFGGLLGSQVILVGSTLSDASGTASFPLPVPADPAFEGLTVNFQAVGANPAGAPLLGLFELSNGLRVRVGDALPACP